jgi:hypothetical protein
MLLFPIKVRFSSGPALLAWLPFSKFFLLADGPVEKK